MSATIGTRAARTISRSAAVLAAVGQETRTMSAPASSQRRIWSIVAAASSVGVFVIVWTLIGASPPTGTEPIMICRDLRRSISRQGRMDMCGNIGGCGRGCEPLDDDFFGPVEPAGLARRLEAAVRVELLQVAKVETRQLLNRGDR